MNIVQKLIFYLNFNCRYCWSDRCKR